MRDKKYYIALNDFERRVVVNCLNEMRNNLIANGKYTDAVDEVLLKIIDAKQKKFKVITRGRDSGKGYLSRKERSLV